MPAATASARRVATAALRDRGTVLFDPALALGLSAAPAPPPHLAQVTAIAGLADDRIASVGADGAARVRRARPRRPRPLRRGADPDPTVVRGQSSQLAVGDAGGAARLFDHQPRRAAGASR